MSAIPSFRNAALTLTALALLPITSLLAAPQLSVTPGKLATIVGKTNNALLGFPDFGNPTVQPALNGIAFGNNAIYISDTSKHVVFKFDRASGNVTVFAGKLGQAGYNGGVTDAPTNVLLADPSAIAVASDGSLYIADDRQNTVWKVNAAATSMSLFAGIANTNIGQPTTPGFSSNGTALGTQLAIPSGLAVDAAGNLYIADTAHNLVERVDSSGNLAVVAGTTTASVTGYDASGPATSVHMSFPTGVAVDSTNQILYIADRQNSVVRKVTLGNGQLVNIAGTHVAGFSGDGGQSTAAQVNLPYAVAVDTAGDVYIADTGSQIIRKIDGSGTITTIAGQANVSGYAGDGGPATLATLNGPAAIAVDTAGLTLYIEDSANQSVRSIATGPGTVTFAATNTQQVLTLTNTGDQNITSLQAALGSYGQTTSCGGTLVPGQSCSITITANGANDTLALSGTGIATLNIPLAVTSGLRYVPITPCRAVDTRVADPTFGGGPIPDQTSRSFPIRNSVLQGNGACPAPGPVPTTADVRAYALNVTVTPGGFPLEYLTIYPTGLATVPQVSTLNAYDGRIKANAAVVPAGSDANRSVSVYVKNRTQVIIDINGYFVPENDPSGLAFYPLPPCRVVDTRSANGTFGGPTLAGAATRNFPLPTSACSVPTGAKAYSLNVTAVPRAGSLNYLTLWPTSAAIPFVSTLNSPNGTVVANAATITADANGSISAYATEALDLILDINGYYGTPSNTGLAYYPLGTPCRAFDSRDTTADLQGLSTKSLTGRDCAGQSQTGNFAEAQEFAVNTTILPTGPVIYLANWANGTAQPVGSTTNSFDGAVNSNLVIVPSLDGSISSFISTGSNNTSGNHPTGLILDVFGYYAP